jgi:hypothetical protein
MLDGIEVLLSTTSDATGAVFELEDHGRFILRIVGSYIVFLIMLLNFLIRDDEFEPTVELDIYPEGFSCSTRLSMDLFSASSSNVSIAPGIGIGREAVLLAGGDGVLDFGETGSEGGRRR